MTSLKTLIRKAEQSDAEAITNLSIQFGFPATQQQTAQRYDLIKQHSHQVIFVAEGSNGEVVGWVHAYEAPSLLSDATVEIGGLVIDETRRRRGVGSALMERVEGWAIERGFNEILLATRIDRNVARIFYERLGFRFVHTTHFLSKNLGDSLSDPKIRQTKSSG